ncbi:hypothetical protein CANCADRAFT_111165 [Tortispora caseinolytica NRRL Y-17796]|uniref:(S)-ureidoglycine aminohydrolase cupin domain-containing protein n=1 Tax=Tortispora caseinolytica NRRL Y-17796 TaxID=767744 RepID=A0A1E4TGG7_9ASCO|nr:hypothetical protein CANCADRAFT_111165 [Tortispora caseinolytica NRRL Y-17796]
MPKINYYPQAQKEYKPPLISSTNAFLGDVFNSKDSGDLQISAGFYRQEKGEPLVYTYTYHEMKIVVEGGMKLTDETGYSIEVKPGDVLYFEPGTTVTFDSPDYCLAFFVGRRTPDGA